MKDTVLLPKVFASLTILLTSLRPSVAATIAERRGVSTAKVAQTSVVEAVAVYVTANFQETFTAATQERERHIAGFARMLLLTGPPFAL